MTRRLVAATIALSVAVLVTHDAASGQRPNAFDYTSWRAVIIDRGLDPADVVYPFRATDEMSRWAQESVGTGDPGPLESLRQLQAALFRTEDFDFRYDDLETLTAEDAFASRRGNCISFTALFIALSRAVGVPTRLMSVTRAPQVERDDGLVVINRHVVAAYRLGREVVVFDFNLRTESELVSHAFIDDVQASAMFHNNLGATALRDDDPVTALRQLELTTILWPEWAAGWVNYGVTVSRLGDTAGALRAYNRALEVDPGNSSALNNMAHAYLKVGRVEEAAVARRAAARSTDNPFTLIAMADSEMVRGNLDEAERYLKRARRAYPREPEVYVGLARLAARRGQDARVERQLRRAGRLRSTPADHP